jgi:predicted dehydrogenase
VDDDTFVALRFEGGATAHLWANQVTADPGPRFREMGLEGAFESRGLDPQEDALKDGGRPGTAGWGLRQDDGWARLVTPGGEADPPRLPGAYEQFYAGVRDAVAEGSPPPVTAEEGARVLEVIEAAIASAADGAVIEL